MLQFVCITLLVLIIYICLVEFYMKKWGVSTAQYVTAMDGDKYFNYTSSTRGILINAPRKTVWTVLIHLGADRMGFFSYSFIENLLGYKSNNHFDPNIAMPIGRKIPSSLNPEKAFINYSWTVLEVEHCHSFVLSNWGSFLIEDVGDKQTKLIVRTYEQESKIKEHIIFPFHFIMERKMLLELKKVSEARFLEDT